MALNCALGLVSLLAVQSTLAWPDLGVTKTGPAEAAPGQVINYTLTYTNKGPAKSTLVELKDFLPNHVSVVSGTLDGGSISGSTITWNLGTMNSRTGGSRSFQVRINTNAPVGGSITNQAEIDGKEDEESGKTANNSSKWITRIIGPPPPVDGFCRAILAKQPITLHGTMLIDSFNSLNPNLSTNGRYDPAKRGDGGNVASISDSVTVITDTGNTKVYGRFETSPTGSVQITGQASVGSRAWVDGGNRGIQPGWHMTNLSAVISDVTLPGLTFTSLPQNSGTVNGTNYTYVLNSGNYSRSSDLTLSSSQRMLISGNVVLYFQKKLTISGQAYIYIAPGAKLTVYLADTTSLSGGGTINGTGFATNCAYLGLPSCTSISFSGNSEYVGTVYAPQATVQMSGGGSQVVNFIGAAVAKAFDISGDYQFHFDEGLCRECLPPQIVIGPGSLTNCPGTIATFSVSATGTGLSYAWFKDNAALSGQTNSILTIPNVIAGNAGTYRVVVTGACGDMATNAATLTVGTPVNATELANVVQPTGGSATFATVASGSGPFTYVWSKDNTILPGQTGSSLTIANIARSDAGNYTVHVSGNCGSVTRSGMLTVANSAPVANNDAYSLAEDTVLTIGAPGVLGNDNDPDNDSLTAIIVGQPLNGTVTLNANGGFVYRPASNYVGMDAFTYKANDGMLDSGVASVTLTITNLNDRPIALNDAYSLAEDTVLTIAAAGVLGNDSDPDNDPLTAAIVGQPANGTVILNANGGFIYSPTTNYTGTDSFTYKANDGLLDSGIATVSITVTPSNDPPVAADDNYSTDEDTTLTVASPGVLTNDSDPDGDAFVVLVMSVPAHGSLTLNTNGGFVYTPTTNYSGNDTFTYRAFDGQTNSNIATATITITPLNDPPVAGNDSYTTPEDSVLNILSPGVLENDSDADGDPLSVMLVNGPAHGAVTLNANGSFAYTPATDYTGPDSFTYKANDGSADSGVAKVNIAVTPLNDPPVAVNDRYSMDEDTTLMVPLPGILGNDSDPDGDSFIAELVSGTAHGALTFGTNGGFNYTPTNNYSGTDSFVYRAFDGQTNSNVATVIITINPLGDRPMANRDSYTTPENTALIISAPGILANDSDPDGDPLIAVLASNPAHGTLTLNADGSFTYVPINQYTGPDSYTYWASDGLTNSGQVGVVITVTPVNDPPVAVNDIYITIEDTALNILAPGVLINDSDLDGDALNAVLVTSPVNGTLALNANGGFIYTPATNYTGPDHFTYRTDDGTLQSAVATASITVTPLNDPPVAVDDNYSTAEDATLNIAAPGVLTNDTDPDGDSLSALLVSDPAHGTLALNPNGSFIYTPTNNFNGLDTFTYRASDGSANSDIATVTIRVTPVNDPPDTNNWNGRSFTLYEDTPLEVRVPGLLAGIVDLDLDALQALFENHPLHGTLTLNTNGSFFHRPVTNYFGSDSFQFRIGDGQILSPILTVNLTVIPVNDAPSFGKGPNQFHQQDPGVQTLPGWAADVSPGPDNEASQSVTFQLSNDNNAMFSVQPAINANGTLTYTPAPNAWGVATVTVVARDDGGTANGGVDSSDPQTFSITVNSPPTVSIVSPTNGASLFVPGNFTLLADAQDLDGTIQKVELFADTNRIAEANSGAPYFAVLTNLPVGSYTYGATATDNHGATGAATPVTVNVLERPPVTFLTSVYYNPQTDFFEQRLRIHNPTYSLLDAVRICVYNLTNLPVITVHNRTGYTNGIPYVQTHAAVPPGSFVDMTVEFHSPMRIKPNPILQAELVPPATAGTVAPGTPQTINRVLMLANKTFMIEFSTLSNRLYSIQYSSNLVHWRAVQPPISGNGNWVQWIDNGQPKTDGPPVTQRARFYRLVLLP